jgi:CRP/FNR family transcriptional regulator, cyclic AMP receptor protein
MNNQSIDTYLTSHEFFTGFNEVDLKFLCDCSSLEQIEQGQMLFRQGEQADKFYVVRTGRISIQMPAIMGPNIEMQSLGSDQILGWSWLISPFKWSFQALAEETSELIRFDGTAILARCEQNPKFGYEMLKKFAGLMSIRLDAARRKMMDEWNPAGFA